MDNMRALILTEDCQLEIGEIIRPEPTAGTVLVKVRAAALNHREIWISKGLYPGMRLPSTLGADGAGVVVACGEGVSEDWINKEVICYPGLGWGHNACAPSDEFRLYGMPEPGFIAQYIAVPVANLVEKPVHLSWEEAAAIPVATLTAWRALVRHGHIKCGTKLLISGVGGGVSQSALMLADAMGAEIFVTSGSQEKIAAALESGAKAGFSYLEEGWETALARTSGGIDVVLDGALPANLNSYYQFLNAGAKIVVYGATITPECTFNIAKLFLRHVSIIGTAMGTIEEFREMMTFIAQRDLRPVVDRCYSFDQAIDALEYLKSGAQRGKIVITL